MKVRLLWVFMVVFSLFLFAEGRAQYMTQKELLMAGDAVQVQIWDVVEETGRKSLVENLSGEYVIDTDGKIIMPFVGLIDVEGRTPAEVEHIVKNKYADVLHEPFIYIRPLIRLTLSGSVLRPGSYRIDPKSSLWDLLEDAGGPTSDADLRKIQVLRGGKTVIKSLLEAFEKAYSLKEVGIRSGDQIIVPEKGHFSFQSLVTILNFGLTIAWLYLRAKDGW